MSLEILTAAFPGNWKQHPVYTFYYFCEDGRAASVIRSKPKILVGTKCSEMGYRAITVYANVRNKKIYIHRAVCELFNGTPPAGYQCRHLDGNHTNNAASNLKWGTPTENNADKIIHGTDNSGERNSRSKLNWEAVKEIRNRVANGESQRSMCKIFNVSPMTISRVVRKELWK